ncbi:MAG: hypothetical protein NZ879_07190 [Archaeoglobaceae archaeon]|nr:hypothetical protein [Archaeoglobaceae archaeon]MDW8118750.1 hypothetical protein [Archaeoglobaceae archaeon]
MKVIILPLLILFLFPIQACVIEIRSATFHPNGTQTVARDWFVVNFTNEYGYDLFDVQIDNLAFFPVVKSGERIIMDPYKNVSPNSFPIAVRINLESRGAENRVEYKVQNYGNDTKVTILIPLFPQFVRCEGCEISNETIVFSRLIGKNESANFSLITSGFFTIPDGSIYFRYEDRTNLSFTANLPVTIEKGRAEKWIGIFRIENTFDNTIETNLTALVEFQNGSRIELFNLSLSLSSGDKFLKVEEIQSEEAPIFYFKVHAKVRDYCKLSIIPATEIDGRYIIEQALLKGFSYFEFFEVSAGDLQISPVITTPTSPPTTPIPEKPKPKPETLYPDVSIPPLGVPTDLKIITPIFLIIFIFSQIVVASFLPVLARKSLVVFEVSESVYKMLLQRRIRLYHPSSIPIPYGIPVKPDEDIVSILLSKGIRRDYAEAISVAMKTRKPLLTEDENMINIALKYNVRVILYGSRFRNRGNA